MGGSIPYKKPPWYHVHGLCRNCYFIYDESATILVDDPCPHCGSRNSDVSLADMGCVGILDMIEHFSQRGDTTNSEAVSELSALLQRTIGRSIDRETLIQTVRVVDEVLFNLDPTGEWHEMYYDDAVQTVQDFLALPTVQQADTAWYIIKDYSPITPDHRMVIVLTNMLLEQLLDGRLIVMAITQDGKDYSSAETYVYKNLAGIDVKRRYFVEHLPRMAASPTLHHDKIKEVFSQAFEQCAPSDFCSEWDAIRQLRNRFVHQDIWTIATTDVERALRLARQAIPIFAEVQNRYCLKVPTSP